MDKVERLQDYLPILRLAAGWSVDHLCELLDKSRPTIWSLEQQKRHMRKSDFLAIMYLFDNEAESNSILRKTLDIVFDDGPDGDLGRVTLAAKAALAKKRALIKTGVKGASEIFAELMT